MKNLMLQSPQAPFALEILQVLKKGGFEAVFAGGCVRDLLLGKIPKDFDIATNALPDQVKGLFEKTVPVGEAFNVILIIPPSSFPPGRFEVATFRADIGIQDGRHPTKVEATTPEEDVKRRDFTINGMLYDPIQDQIMDWVGGEDDLKKGIVRSIGEPLQRMNEDYLRMLRAVRFSARFRFPIDPELWKAIQLLAPKIHKISAERIYDELTKMLTGPNADFAFTLLDESGLLAEIMPEALAMKGCQQPAEYHPEGDVWIHTLLLLKQCEGKSQELAWGALLHDIGKPPTFSHEPPDRIRFNNHQNIGAEMAQVILKRLKCSNRIIDEVCELVRDHLKFKDAPQMRPSTLKRFLRNPLFPLHLDLHRIDCMASHQDLKLYHFCLEQLAALPPEVLKPEPLVDGNDLIKLGLVPGPHFKVLLEAVETEQLEGRLQSKDEALNFIKSHSIFKNR